MPSKEEKIAAYISRLGAKMNVETLLRPGQRAGQEASESPRVRQERDAAKHGLDEIIKNKRAPTPEQAAGIEAIILPKIRPVLDIVDGKFQTDHPLWMKLNKTSAARQNLLNAIPSIGRIELPGHPDYPYGGTGFVVGDGLIMTNRHVAAIFSSGVGMQRLAFKPGRRAGIDFLRELDRPTGATLRIKRAVMVHPYWDMALLAVEGLTSQNRPLPLSLRDVPQSELLEVAAIGYPAFDTRNDEDVQNDLFRNVFGVKRLQPGTLGGRQETESFGKMVSAVRHNCSTLGGNSGSALIDLESGEVIALHFGGRYRATNYAIPANELAKDRRVIDAGVTFAGEPIPGQSPWDHWWNRDGEGISRDSQTGGGNTYRATDLSAPPSAEIKARTLADGSLQFVVPLSVTIRLGDGMPVAIATAAGQGESDSDLERLVSPWHDDDYSTRKGYDPGFLGVEVPLPKPADEDVVALAKDGSPLLHYENFSIVTHAERRMALFVASNVTAEPHLKRPEPGRVYTRKGLSGLGKNDQERWFLDPRLGAEYQLPDVFYNRDDGSFDKGHVVRREDVAWGKTYAVLRRANGDTYHVTNCSPQVAGFNRSSLGDDNWGDLEDHVLKGAASERYCQFAGPLLDSSDQVFVGAGGGRVRLRIKIPSRYWKIIVVRTVAGVASYGFVLEQDLSDVVLEEFAVPQNFARFLEPLADIAKRAGLTLPDIVRDSDQFDTNDGLEIALHSGLRRRSIAEGVIEEGVIV